MLDIFLADNRHVWELQSYGCYMQRCPSDDVERSAQKLLMKEALRAARTV